MKKETLYLLILGIVYLIFINIIGLGGEYPLGDDWSYNLALKHFIETGEIRLSGWTSMPLLTQILTGWLFSFGEFSFQGARISTVILSFFSIYLLYFISKKLGRSTRTSFINSLLLLTNPLFIHFSISYNTDANYIFWFLLYLFLILKYIKSNNYFVLFLSFLVFILSVLLRDLTFIIPVSVILYEVIHYLKYKEIKAKNIYISLTFICVFVLSTYLYRIYLESNNNIPELFYHQKNVLFNNLFNPIELISNIFKSSFKMMIYLSVYLFIPMFIAIYDSSLFKNKKLIILSLVISFIVIIVNSLFYGDKLFNFVFSDFLRYEDFIGSYLMMQIFINIILFISINSMVICLSRINLKDYNLLQILLIIFVLYISLFSLIHPFARYLIVLIPIFSIYYLDNIKKHNFIFTILFLFLLSLFQSVPLAKDNHTLINALWDKAKKIELEAVSTDSINAGFEYSGWHHYEKSKKILINNIFIDNPSYIISTNKNYGYEILDSSEVNLINLSRKETFIYIMRKK